MDHFSSHRKSLQALIWRLILFVINMSVLFQVLTLDYDYMSDRLLSVLSTPYNSPMRRLVVHVHGIDQTHRGTTEYMWYRFKQQQ